MTLPFMVMAPGTSYTPGVVKDHNGHTCQWPLVKYVYIRRRKVAEITFRSLEIVGTKRFPHNLT